MRVASITPPVARVHHARARGRQQATVDLATDTETEVRSIHGIGPLRLFDGVKGQAKHRSLHARMVFVVHFGDGDGRAARPN